MPNQKGARQTTTKTVWHFTLPRNPYGYSHVFMLKKFLNMEW